MIHNVLLIQKDGNVVVKTRFWKIDFGEEVELKQIVFSLGNLMLQQMGHRRTYRGKY